MSKVVVWLGAYSAPVMHMHEVKADDPCEAYRKAKELAKELVEAGYRVTVEAVVVDGEKVGVGFPALEKLKC